MSGSYEDSSDSSISDEDYKEDADELDLAELNNKMY